jgi:two-component system, OmpR family, sensor kinase
VIIDELNRMTLAGDRVIRTFRMHHEVEMRPHDLQALLRSSVDRWSVLADRTWGVSCEPLMFLCSPERLRACLDTLMENAVRYTGNGDTVRVFATKVDKNVVIGVADSGPGMDPMMLRALSTGQFGVKGPPGAYVARDPKAQTGLGLALVWEAAEARDGRLVAGVSAEGGALVAMVLPDRSARPMSVGPYTLTGMDRCAAQRV